MYYKLSHPFPQVHELISLAKKTKRRCPHNLKLRSQSVENSVPVLQSVWKTDCLLGRYFTLTVTSSNGFTLAPQDRERGLSRKSTLCCISSSPLWPCSSSSAFYLSNLALVSLLDTFPAEAGMVPCLSKNVPFFVLVNKQKNRAYPMVFWVFCFGLGIFFVYVLGEKQRKEILNLS